jgi:hypothetical protein
MNDLGLRPGKKHIKCAKICGDTSGNYHPHGESVIYPTLVGMAQAWKMRVPLVDPQGNFGSIDGDPPAAMRYTEARMRRRGGHARRPQARHRRLPAELRRPPHGAHRPARQVPQPADQRWHGHRGGHGDQPAAAQPAEIFDAIVRGGQPRHHARADDRRRPTRTATPSTRASRAPTSRPAASSRAGGASSRPTSTGAARSPSAASARRGDARPGASSSSSTDPLQLVQNTLVEKIVEAVKDERIKDISDVRNESGATPRRGSCRAQEGRRPGGRREPALPAHPAAADLQHHQHRAGEPPAADAGAARS